MLPLPAACPAVAPGTLAPQLRRPPVRNALVCEPHHPRPKPERLAVRTASPTRVATWLTPRERDRVDAAAAGHFVPLHSPTLGAVREAVMQGRAEGALVSAALAPVAKPPALAALVRMTPVGLVAGLVDDLGPAEATAGTFALGRAGVATVVDARVPGGWAALRRVFAQEHTPHAFLRVALKAVLADLRGTERSGGAGNPLPESQAGAIGDGVLAFFRIVFTPGVRTARQVAARLGVAPSSLMSRFFRASLPSPKRYVVGAHLIHVAHLAEQPGMSMAAIAYYLDASSPQSLGRMIQTYTGLRPGEMRHRYTGASMLERFRRELVLPYRATLRTFDPLAPSWREAPYQGQGRARVAVGVGRVES